MLMILEDKDPTLRLSARSWLQESKSNYSRIIDPLLKEFMSNSQMYRSITGQLFYEQTYNATYVKENFAKLRNIILTTQEEFMEYILVSEYTDYIADQFSQTKQLMEVDVLISPEFIEPTEQRTIKSKGKYIQVIIYLTLQFIMGHYVECLSEELY